MPRFNSASLSIAAAVPFISAVTAAPFVSDATAALFERSTDEQRTRATSPERPHRSDDVKSLATLRGRSRFHGETTQNEARSDLSERPTEVAPEVRSDLLERPAQVARVLTGRDTKKASGATSGSDYARLTMITADIISSRLSSGKHSSKMDMVALILAKSQRISGGFIGPFKLRIMIYLLLMKCFPLDSSGTSWLLVLPSSHKEWISYLLSMKGYTFSVLLLSSGFSFSTGLSSCVAVSTGPEEATEITFGFLVGESWLSTSHYVTIFQLDVKVLYAHSRFVSNSLSSFYEGLSHLSFNQRRCLTSSSYCTRAS
uniref:Uncharacterized protein n=1 Tax=Brassica oleracea var. oleracea TaxID=109376 RepID=A0A0D3CQJ1_BRAOL